MTQRAEIESSGTRLEIPYEGRMGASLNDSLPYSSKTAFPMNTITTPFRQTFIFTLLALFLTGAGWLQAGSAGIQDNAGFFSLSLIHI